MKLKTQGILRPYTAASRFQITRHAPSDDLAGFIERYWIIRWDLRGQPPHVQETLPYPCVNLVFEKNRTRIYGVETGRSAQQIEGQGQVLGIKFKPGGFYPFIKAPLSHLTNRSIPLEEVFGAPAADLESAVLASTEKQVMIDLAEEFLRTHRPAPDENVQLIDRIIECITSDPGITRVDDVVRRVNLNERGLQRLFNKYVGVSPKWVVQSFRMQEAAERLAQDAHINLPGLAAELGYYDQAHFSKEFKAIVGCSPAEYAKIANRKQATIDEQPSHLGTGVRI